MGFGDEIMGSGMAHGAAARGKRVAFGDGRRIIWHDRNPAQIFKNNPNVATPGSSLVGVEWIDHYPGKRRYCTLQRDRKRWTFTPGTQRIGEIFFGADEFALARSIEPGFVLIESKTKSTAPNKQWPRERYAQVATRLTANGHRVVQFNDGLSGVPIIQTKTFRQAMVALSRARLYIGPEGGLHHAAAALGVPAVVIFGGFISPEVTGYAPHTNLFVGDDLGCGNLAKCGHCQRAMGNITTDQVFECSMKILNREDVYEARKGFLSAGSRDALGTLFGGRSDVRKGSDVSTSQAAGNTAAHQELSHGD